MSDLLLLVSYVCLLSCRISVVTRRITSNRWFDYSILVIIALNCITLAMERPAIPDDCIVSIRRRY